MSGCGCGCNTEKIEGEAKQILEALAKAEKPYGSKDIVEVTNIDKKVISKQVAALKKKGFVNNPVRCKYGITENGRKAIS